MISQSAKYPTLPECLDLMTTYRMLPNIREHSERVRDVALMVAGHLTAAGVALDLGLIEAGALLHDIAKTATLHNGGEHARLGAQWLIDLGYPAVAEIVREHVWLSRSPSEPGPLREAEMVNYADKRVLHNQVVTLPRRFADLRSRYGRTPEISQRILSNEKRSLILEQKIFARLTISPDDILVLNLSGGGND
jgi:putative nucleotidyltransferase with HDIG domain